MELYYKKSEIEDLKILGAGCEAKVYLDDTKSKVSSNIALKVYYYPFKYDHNKREKIRILSNLDNPYITKPFDDINDEEYCCGYYMENFKSTALSKQELTSFDRRLNILYSLKEGIEKLHEKDIVVADLRPANILVNEKDEVKLCDVDGFKVGKYDAGWLNVYSNIYFEKNRCIDNGIDIFSFNLLTLFYLLNYSKEEKDRAIYANNSDLDSLEERDRRIQKVLRNPIYSKKYIIDDKELQKETKLII